MKTLKQALIDITAKNVCQIGEFERLGWPPDCMGIYYQPERPKIAEEETYNTTKNENSLTF